MSLGIADAGQRATASPRPFPLPAQALDHATGYFIAAAACRGLARLLAEGVAGDVHLSLAGTARILMGLGATGDPRGPDLDEADVAPYREAVETPWGPLRRIRCPGRLDGLAPALERSPGPLGKDAPRFAA
jgi:hypothetical protein